MARIYLVAEKLARLLERVEKSQRARTQMLLLEPQIRVVVELQTLKWDRLFRRVLPDENVEKKLHPGEH